MRKALSVFRGSPASPAVVSVSASLPVGTIVSEVTPVWYWAGY
jgi:hypothetical protein